MARASGWQPEGRGFESRQLHSQDAGAITVGANRFRSQFGYYMECAAAGEEIEVTRRGKPTVRLTASRPKLPPR
jgi:prevent-host-death family protein